MKNIIKAKFGSDMGVAKYKELGRDYKLKGVPAMNKEKASMLESYVRSKLNLN